MNAQLILNCLQATGTVAGVLTVGGNVYLRWRMRPRLTLTCPVGDSCLERNQDFVIVRSEKQDIIEYRLRLRVYATSGKRRVTNAQCRVVRVISLTGPGDQEIPCGPLAWSSMGTASQDIMPGSWLNVDLLVYHIRHPEHKRALHVATDCSFTSGRSQTALGDGLYEIYLHVGGNELPTTYWRVVLDHHAIPETTSDVGIRAQVRIVSLTKFPAPRAASFRMRRTITN
jgi:hypothetical protein